MGCPRCQPQRHKNPQRLYSPLPDPTTNDKVTNHHKWLCTSSQEQLIEALHAPMQKQAVELVRTQKSLGFFNQLFLVPKPNIPWRSVLDLSTLNKFLKTEKLKMETSGSIWNSLQTGMGDADRLQGHLLILILIKRPVRDTYLFSPKFRLITAAAALWSPLNNFLAFQIFLPFLSFFKTIGSGKIFEILCADLKLYLR